jgi:signal transduction histidine kinase/DNA-binding NarL/FixJ family response regulator
MRAVAVSPAPSSPGARQALIRDLQQESAWLVVPGMVILNLVLMVIIATYRGWSDAGAPCLILYVLLGAAWVLGRWNQRAQAWAMIAWGLVAVWLLVTRVHLPGAACLLMLPVMLAALFVDLWAGALVAGLCTALLLTGLPDGTVAPADLRLFVALACWGAVGIAFLAWRMLGSLLDTVQWSWRQYEDSRAMLDQARNQQVELKQALADLADANEQLTRLNRLAQGLQQAAEEARRAKEQFVANVSHELRTPLNMIIGFCEMIVESPQTYGKIPRSLMADLTVVLRNSQHLSALIDDVLDLSQVEAGHMALSKEHVALAEIIEAAAKAVGPLYDSKHLYLHTSVAEDLPPVYCDPTRIRQVVLNLLSNAGRFTEAGGVQVRARREGEDAIVSVADTGPGIAAEDAAKVFEPFQQLDDSIRRRHGGSGLGLSISKNFVELHDGRMWFESRPGVGTTFLFRLPINPPVPLEAGAARWLVESWPDLMRTSRPMSPLPKGRPRFVVLEAGDALRRLLVRYLGDVEIAQATELEGALAALVDAPAKALLMNASSVAEGLQELAACHDLPFGTPAIVCSVRGLLETAEALGVAAYLLKPIPRDRLLAVLERLNLRGKTLLVVDDEPEVLQLLWRMLVSSGAGYRVLPARDGEHALALLRDQHPDAVLLDLVMPGMDGYQFLSIKNADPALKAIPVVVFSAQDPASQAGVANLLGVARGGGLSLTQVVSTIDALTQILSVTDRTGDPGLRAAPSG